MSVSEPPPAVPRMRLWLRLLFGLSLALNLLVIGLIAGAAWRLADAPGGGPSGTIGLTMMRALSADDRKALRAVVMDLPAQKRRSGSRSKEADRIAALMRADPLDTAALQAELSDQIARRMAVQANLQMAWITFVADMPRSDRLAYADRIEKIGKRKRRVSDRP